MAYADADAISQERRTQLKALKFSRAFEKHAAPRMSGDFDHTGYAAI